MALRLRSALALARMGRMTPLMVDEMSDPFAYDEAGPRTPEQLVRDDGALRFVGAVEGYDELVLRKTLAPSKRHLLLMGGFKFDLQSGHVDLDPVDIDSNGNTIHLRDFEANLPAASLEWGVSSGRYDTYMVTRLAFMPNGTVYGDVGNPWGLTPGVTIPASDMRWGGAGYAYLDSSDTWDAATETYDQFDPDPIWPGLVKQSPLFGQEFWMARLIDRRTGAHEECVTVGDPLAGRTRWVSSARRRGSAATSGVVAVADTATLGFTVVEPTRLQADQPSLSYVSAFRAFER